MKFEVNIKLIRLEEAYSKDDGSLVKPLKGHQCTPNVCRIKVNKDCLYINSKSEI